MFESQLVTFILNIPAIRELRLAVERLDKEAIDRLERAGSEVDIDEKLEGLAVGIEDRLSDEVERVIDNYDFTNVIETAMSYGGVTVGSLDDIGIDADDVVENASVIYSIQERLDELEEKVGEEASAGTNDARRIEALEDTVAALQRRLDGAEVSIDI